MNVAYLVQSHRNVPQVVRLVRTLHRLDPAAGIYVSHDASGDPGAAVLGDEPGVRVRLATGERGQFSLLQRWAESVEDVHQDGGADFVVLLSGQDYPVRPAAELHAALAESGDGYLERFAALRPEGNPWTVREGRNRFCYRWRTVVPLSDRGRDRLHLLHGLNRLQPFLHVNVAYGALRVGVRSSGAPQDLEVFGGSAFTMLSWRAVEHVVTTMRTRPDVMRWARSSLNIDEAFMQTVLMAASGLRFAPTAGRYFRFEGSRFGHPRVLTVSDVPGALASGDFFARKFDTDVDARALDAIDAELGL